MKKFKLISLTVLLFSLTNFAYADIIKCFSTTGNYIEVKFGYKDLKSRSLSFKTAIDKSINLRTNSPLNRTKTYSNEDYKLFVGMDRDLTKVYKLTLTSLKPIHTTSFSARCLSLESESYEASKIETTTVSNIKSNYKIFNKVDELGIVKLKLRGNPLDFRYDVLYYIPKRAKERKDLEVLVFLHGGGESTTKRSTSMGAIELYTKSMMKMARSLGVALVMPSATGLNWSDHTVSYLKEIKALIKSDMPIYDNRIGLIGHSMGAMGITRSVPFLTDDYSFFVSLAGGAESKSTTENMLKTYINTSYTHIQGEGDLINVFVPRSIKQNEKVRELEVSLNKKIDFDLIMHKGGHDFEDFAFKDLALLVLDKVENKRINFYQKEIYGALKSKEGVVIDEYSNGNHYFVNRIDSSFWIKALSFEDIIATIFFEASIDNQTVNIDIDPGVKELRIYLSQKMLDVQKMVSIKVNSSHVVNKTPVCIGSDNLNYSCFVDIKI